MGFYSDPLIHVWNARFYCYLPHFCFRAYVCHTDIAHIGILGEQKSHCAMEQRRNSQVVTGSMEFSVTGSMGCAHHHIQEGIMDTCVGRKMSVTLEQTRFLISPNKWEPPLEPHASSGQENSRVPDCTAVPLAKGTGIDGRDSFNVNFVYLLCSSTAHPQGNKSHRSCSYKATSNWCRRFLPCREWCSPLPATQKRQSQLKKSGMQEIPSSAQGRFLSPSSEQGVVSWLLSLQHSSSHRCFPWLWCN